MARASVAILSSVHDVGDARIHRHAAALLAAGYEVQLWGTGDIALAPPHVQARALPRVGLVRRLGRAATLPWRTDADVIVSVDPDVAVACQGRARWSRRVIHVADVHEDYEALLADRSWARGLTKIPARAIAVLGRRAAERADLTTVADDHIVPRAKNRAVVRNVPVLPASVELERVPRAVYVGDVRESRGLDVMLEAIAASPGWTLDIIGPISASELARVAAPLEQLGDRVRLHGRLSPTESWARAAGAWAGFVMLDATPAFVDATPSKLYEYLAYGIPVIATPLPRHVEILTASGGGEIAGNAREAALALARRATQPDLARAMSDRGRAWAEGAAVFASGSAVLAERIGKVGLPPRLR